MEPAQLQREEAQQDLRAGNVHSLKKNKKVLSRCKLTLMFFQAMIIINGYLYVFGGTTGYLYSTDLHRLDLSTREWTHLKPNNAPSNLPEERSLLFLTCFYNVQKKDDNN